MIVSAALRRASAHAILGLLLAGPAGATETDTDSDGALVPTTAPSAAPAAVLPMGTVPDDLIARALEVRALPLPERMAAISELMLQRPYTSDPLGEGSGVDADPLARYDTYDCLTFLEEVLALALAGDPRHASPVRLGLRYGQDDPTYVHRHHFMELQWVPEAIQNGWLRDTTAEYGTPVAMHRDVDAATWETWRARGRFAHRDDELPVGAMDLQVLSLDDALAAVDRIRPGTLVLTVRVDRPWKPIWTSHVGFVMPHSEGKPPQVRHATRMADKVVRDHGLAWYLEHLKTYRNWPVAGVALLEPIEQGPRRARLP